jgi:hypothetical protein
VQMKVARVKHNHDSKTRKMDYQKLHDQDTKDHFTLEHRNRFALLENGFIRQEVDTDINTKWIQIKELYTDTAQEVLGYKIKTKKTWMLHNSWELIKERKKLKQIINQANTMDREEILKIQYRDLRKKIKKSTRGDKRIWTEDLANKVEVAASINVSQTLCRITEVLSNKNVIRSHPIKDTNGKLLINPDDQLSRWKSHFGALLSEQTEDANDQEEENRVTSSGTCAAINIDPPTKT